ncbi:NAD(P)H-dependent glycerol-3-phosphate dehydrogenase [Mesorhizobium sp. BAC0120]|uniref:NAD(P)H-dependent glycerol-3-phosphate dehydrogenase n=1 Tax=Mesorhizobium sp. BAC0120 TaxID=3090670 RepID=UPI00298CDAD0|nr:NAD(P)H-dependent glycerol-3-phosphate dehydrogenase [Mesorhizobium sp. BAC0120]MDW6022122.1 NAD(P)H-dependent glycerol-3-phosphate dehydrogenase [Mesorhizobium sp. BAC0120]
MTGNRITVLGGGAWGTALALVARRAGHEVLLWARDAASVEAIRNGRENARYLPGIRIDPGILATDDPGEALDGADHVLAAVPAQHLRDVLTRVASQVMENATLILCAKGIERSTGKLLSAVVEEVLPGRRIAALSGPSFATDVAKGLPTAVVVAAPGEERAAELARLLSAEHFRCYSTDDLTGVEVGGALKNVLAIAAGTVIGASLGASAQAAMVTRGFVELRRLAASFGARPETIMGLSGLGDLLLTCSTPQSRNFSYGLALGRGDSLADLPLAEGVATASIAARIAAERGIDAPIINAVDRLLAGELRVGEAVSELMARPLRSEED